MLGDSIFKWYEMAERYKGGRRPNKITVKLKAFNAEVLSIGLNDEIGIKTISSIDFTMDEVHLGITINKSIAHITIWGGDDKDVSVDLVHFTSKEYFEMVNNNQILTPRIMLKYVHKLMDKFKNIIMQMYE